MTASNEERAERAFRSLVRYKGETEEKIVDLASDLLHLATQYGIEPEELLRLALLHYSAEKVA